MNVLVAMDSFKGSLSAHDLSKTIEQTLLTINNSLNITVVPIADGGEGTIEALQHIPHAKRIAVTVHNPLMTLIKAHYLMLDNKAIIEMAQAAGLTRLKSHQQNPLYTTSYGVGEMIKDALKRGVESVIITVGGSATHDGGIGLLAALGYRFYDINHTLLDPIGKNLRLIETIDDKKAIPISNTIRFHVACDVTNPPTGPTGAAYIYAKQKGATPIAIKNLEAGLNHYIHLLRIYNRTLNITQPGLGAAGGLPLSLVAFFNTRLASGADMIFDMLKIDQAIKQSDIIITGEGKVDYQTFQNKAVHNLLKRTHACHKPAIVLAGRLEKAAEKLSDYGTIEIKSIHNDVTQISDSMLTKTYTKKRLNITIKSLAHYFK